MTLDKYLGQVADLFDVKQRKCDRKKHCLKEALKKLKKRKSTLESRLDKQKSDKARKSIKRELKVIHAQRYKGLKLLKDLSKK